MADFDLKDVNIEIRTCCTHEELDECVHLQQEIWKFDDLDTVPRRVFIVTQSIGGVTLGAYASHDGRPILVGFIWALPGARREPRAQVYIHVEMLAVHPKARKQHVAQRLMVAIREYALSQNIALITATFDPTNTKLAYLYINRFGGIARRYIAHYYGLSSSLLHKLSTDRLYVEWWLNSLVLKHECWIHSEPLFSDSDHIDEVDVPAKMAEWKRVDDAQAVEAQRDICEKLTKAFEKGLTILSFRLERDGTGVYQLGHCSRILKEDNINE